jgi:tRNA(His) 5'-end guanylyltransferase
MQNDSLGDRMKTYENAFRFYVPIHSYLIVRVDGKAFHTFTRHCDRPFDSHLIAAMDATALALCQEMQNSCFAYTQSDEISILLYDFTRIGTSAWFDNNMLKICSVSAALATSNFIRHFFDPDHMEGPIDEVIPQGLAFDGRLFILPTKDEVANYYVWRQQDCTRNSVQMAARAMFSHKECYQKNNAQLQEMLFQKGYNWDDCIPRCKRGGFVDYETSPNPTEENRPCWKYRDPPIFTQDRPFLLKRIPDPLQDEPK